MPKKNPLGPGAGPMIHNELLAGAAQASQLRTIQAMIAARPPHAPALAALDAARPAFEDPQRLFAAAGVDRGALEAEFKALTGQLAGVDGGTRATLLRDFEGRWGRALAQMRAAAGASAPSEPGPSGGERRERPAFFSQYPGILWADDGAEMTGNFNLHACSGGLLTIQTSRAAVGTALEIPPTRDLLIRVKIRLFSSIRAYATSVAGYASAGFVCRIYARVSSLDGGWSQNLEGEDWQFPGHYTRGAYAPVAGASVLEVSQHDAVVSRVASPGGQDPLRLEIWVVASSWGAAAGIAWSEVDHIHGQIAEIYVGAA